MSVVATNMDPDAYPVYATSRSRCFIVNGVDMNLQYDGYNCVYMGITPPRTQRTGFNLRTQAGADAAAKDSVVLDALASQTDDKYMFYPIWVFGEAAGSYQYIYQYDGTTGKAHLMDDLVDVPAAGYAYHIDASVSLAQVGGGTVDIGVHNYLYTYYNITHQVESNPCQTRRIDESSNLFTLPVSQTTIADTTKDITLSKFAYPADTQVTHIKIYRTKIGDTGTYYYVGQIELTPSDNIGRAYYYTAGDYAPADATYEYSGTKNFIDCIVLQTDAVQQDYTGWTLVIDEGANREFKVITGTTYFTDGTDIYPCVTFASVLSNDYTVAAVYYLIPIYTDVIPDASITLEISLKNEVFPTSTAIASVKQRIFMSGSEIFDDGRVIVTNGSPSIYCSSSENYPTEFSQSMVGMKYRTKGVSFGYRIVSVEDAYRLTLAQDYLEGSSGTTATDGLEYTIVGNSDDVYYSEIDLDGIAQPQSTDLSVNVVPTNEEDNDYVVALLPYGDDLLVGCRRHLYNLAGGDAEYLDAPTLVHDIGVVSKRCLINVEGKATFLSDGGVYQASNASVDDKPLSLNAPKLFSNDTVEIALNKDAWMTYDSASKDLYIGQISLDSLKLDHINVYNITLKSWTRITGINANCGTMITEIDGVRRLYTGDDYGMILRHNIEDNYNDGTGSATAVIGVVATDGYASETGVLTKLADTRSFPTTGDGLRGCKIRMLNGDCAGAEAYILSNDATTLTTAGISLGGNYPGAADVFQIAAIDFFVKTGWFDGSEQLDQPINASMSKYWNRLFLNVEEQAPDSTVDCTLVNASATVTSTAGFTQTMLGKNFIPDGDGVEYFIVGYASTSSITLDRVYEGLAATGKSCDIGAKLLEVQVFKDKDSGTPITFRSGDTTLHVNMKASNISLPIQITSQFIMVTLRNYRVNEAVNVYNYGFDFEPRGINRGL